MIPKDSFFRNLFLEDQFDRDAGVIFGSAFKPKKEDKGEGISVTRSDPHIMSYDMVEQYIDHASKHLSRKLGCCEIRQSDVQTFDQAAYDEQSKITKTNVPAPLPSLKFVDAPLHCPDSGELSTHIFDKSHCLVVDPLSDDRCPEVLTRRLLARVASQSDRVKKWPERECRSGKTTP